MRFWQKILIGTLLITLVTFDLGTYILVRNAYQFTLQRETESARREEHVIFTNLTEEIKKEISINPNLLEDSNRLRAIIRNFSTHYSVTFAFYHNNMLVFNNAPDADIRLPSTLLIQEASVDGGHYIFISQPLDEFPELMLVYARDITALDEFSQSITNIFIGFSVIISLILAIALFLMVKKLTHPIGKLIQTTNEIAGGAFDRRVQIQSRDEFGILAENFNRMADSVEQKVEQLIEAAAQKERFINNLSHEMRTPLTSIMGYAGFMQNANCSEADRMVAAGHLEESAVRLKKLGDKLMEMVALKNF